MRGKWVWWYVVAALAIAGVHWRLPGDLAPAVVWDALSLTAVAAAYVGLRVNRPADPWPWRLLTIGLCLLAAGDVIWDLSVFAFGEDPMSFVVQSDAVYLAAYPFLALGLFLAVRHRRVPRDALIDGTAVALAIAAPLWQLATLPTLESASGTGLERIITSAYPLMDVALIVGAAYLVLTQPRWTPSSVLLVGGILLTAAGDVTYALLLADGSIGDAAWLNPVWPASYTLLGAAILHPSMRELARPVSEAQHPFARPRMAMLAVALLAVPTMLLVQRWTGAEITTDLGVFGLLIAGVVAWRFLRLVREIDAARAEVSRNNERLHALVAHASDAVTVGDMENRPLFVSGSAETLLGRRPESLVGIDPFQLVHPDDRQAAERTFGEVIANPGRTYVSVARVRHADGTWRWIESTTTNRLDEPAVRGIVTNFRDITEQHRTAAMDARATRTLEMIVDGRPPASTLEDLLASVDEHLGTWRTAIELLDPDTGEHVVTIAGAPTAASAAPARWCVGITARDSWRQVGRLTVYGDTDAPPAPADIAAVERVAALAAVVIDRAAAEDQLEHQAFHDPLTGLPNRTLLLDRLGQAVLRLGRHKQGNLAVMFLDLDRFKVINDSLGHDAGDELLLEVGRRLVHALQASDTVARFGGDEFVVVCENVGGAADARAVAERLTAALDEPFALSRGGPFTSSASIGIAIARGPHDRPEALLRDADAAMYRAKERGGARVEVFDSALRSHVVVRLDTERSLRRAIERDELRARYQPVVALTDERHLGAEALVRWRHPSRGLIAPAQFIDIAEETGLIVPIGDWMLGQACRQLQLLDLVPEQRDLVISVNLSGRQLAQPDLVGAIGRHLDECGVEPVRLALEVTESVLLDDVEASVAALQSLKDLGVWLAVDDFGTGYSSLGYLKEFPFDWLKLDQAFTAGLGASEADDAIVFATAQMAHALGMRVIAEGVETPEQRDRARELGCDWAQGYLFAPPGRAEDVFGSERLRVVAPGSLG